MSKCDCWHEVNLLPYSKEINGVCYGTKNQEYCQCHGDTSKCDFYPEKRKENKTMKTLEMMNAAKETGKTYQCDSIFYFNDVGFVDSIGNFYDMDSCVCTINEFIEFDWQEVNAMTHDEAEEKYGIKIIG